MCNIKRRRKRNPYMTRRYWIHKLHTRIACVMLVIMLFFTVANIIKPDAESSERENRNLAQRPSFQYQLLQTGALCKTMNHINQINLYSEICG